MKMKKIVLLLTTLMVLLGLGGPAAAEYTYVESLKSYEDWHSSPAWGLTTWTGMASSLEEAITGAPDYDPDNSTGDALGWQQGYGNYVLDFGSLLSGDLDITFWHFGGINWGGDENELVYMYVSSDGVNWTPSYTAEEAGAVKLEDVSPGGATLYETTYGLYDTFGVSEFQYLMIHKISGGAKTGKFIDAVGVSAVPLPGAVWLMGTGLLGLIGLRRKKG